MKKIYSWQQAVVKSSLQPTTRHVLLTLGTHMNQHGESCYPSIETLIEETGLGRTTIFKHIALAEAAGYLIREKRNVTGKEWASNEYRASIPEGYTISRGAPDAPHEEGVHQTHPSSETAGLRGSADAPHVVENADKGCTSGTQGVHQTDPNYPVEQSNKLASYENSDLEEGASGQTVSDDYFLSGDEVEAKQLAEQFFADREEIFGKAAPKVNRRDISKARQYLALEGMSREFLSPWLKSRMVVMRSKRMDAPFHLGYFEQSMETAVQEAAKERKKPKPVVQEVADPFRNDGHAVTLAFIEQMRGIFPIPVVQAWFAPQRFSFDSAAGVLRIEAEKKFSAGWIADKHGHDLRRIALGLHGKPQVEIVVERAA